MPRFDKFLSKPCFNDFLNKQRYQLALFQCRLFFHKYAKYLFCLIFKFQKCYQLTVLLMSPFLSQIRQILGSFVSPRRYEGTPWWIPWCQQPCWSPKGLRGILPMPLLCQGLCQEELERKRPLNFSLIWFIL